MPCLSARFEVGVGPLINIGVYPGGTLPQTGTPTTQASLFPALVDTGASSTCVSLSVAQSVGLRAIGKRPLISATQTAPVNIYLVDFIIPFGNVAYIISSSQALEFVPDGRCPFQILMGRDIICRGAFTLSFDGHFTFSI